LDLVVLFFSVEVFFLVLPVGAVLLPLDPVELLPVDPLPLEGVEVFGAVEPGSVVSAGAVLSLPSGTIPGVSPELAVGSA
jgi:hypothetical protein